MYIWKVKKYDEEMFIYILLLVNKVKQIHIRMEDYFYLYMRLQIITKFARQISDIKTRNFNFKNVSFRKVELVESKLSIILTFLLVLNVNF